MGPGQWADVDGLCKPNRRDVALATNSLKVGSKQDPVVGWGMQARKGNVFLFGHLRELGVLGGCDT